MMVRLMCPCCLSREKTRDTGIHELAAKYSKGGSFVVGPISWHYYLCEQCDFWWGADPDASWFGRMRQWFRGWKFARNGWKKWNVVAAPESPVSPQ